MGKCVIPAMETSLVAYEVAKAPAAKDATAVRAED